jgi:hypothetical protein
MGEGKHVRFTVNSRGARARAVSFGAGARLPVPEGEPAQATFTLEVNEWNGVSEPRLVLRRAQPAAEPNVGAAPAPVPALAPAPAVEPVPALAPALARVEAVEPSPAKARVPSPAQAPAAPDEDGELVLFVLP